MASRAQTIRIASRILDKFTQQRRCFASTTSITGSASSASADEVAHFDALASEWWSPHGTSGLLHQMNPLRHDFIRTCHSTNPSASSSSSFSSSPSLGPQRRYLDVGCGGGIFAESAARLPDTKSVLAIDPSSEVIKVAQRHALSDPLLQEPGRLIYENKSIEDLPIPDSPEQQYDILTLFEVIEHIPFPAPFLKQCLPFVKPGGWIILSTIARTWASWVTTKVVAEDIIGLVPRGTHEWAKYVNEEELRSWFLKQHGWGQMDGGVRCEGVVYVPGMGWRMVEGAERWGNYFWGVRKQLT